MASARTLREIALERTFSLYLGHFALWLALVLPVVATGTLVFLAARAALLGTIGPGAYPETVRTAMAIAWTAAVVWGLAGIAGGQVGAIRAWERGRTPSVNSLLLAVLVRAPQLLATASLLVLIVAGVGLAGVGLATAVIWAPRLLLPALGIAEGTARSLSLLIALPMLVAGVLPALWALGRLIVALPLSAASDVSPISALTIARRVSRGHVVTIVGLIVVTLLANSVVVLLSRAAGSLITLLFWREQFRPLFGTGPLEASATGIGALVQLGTTALASVVTLPLILLPITVFALELTKDERSAHD
jgi:hypothetical protein